MIKRILKAFRGAKSDGDAPEKDADERVSVIAIGPPRSGKTSQWYATVEISDEDRARDEVTVILDQLSVPAADGDESTRARSAGMLVRRRVGDKHVPIPTGGPKEEPGSLIHAEDDGDSRKFVIRDVPGEWFLGKRHTAQQLAEEVDGAKLMIVVLPPEFVFSDGYERDEAQRMLDACVETVISAGRKAHFPPFIALCYAKTDEYGFAPPSSPRMLTRGQVRSFARKGASKSAVQTAMQQTMGEEAGEVARKVVGETWRCWETILKKKHPWMNAYWVAADPAVPGFDPRQARGVHHLFADFGKHLHNFDSHRKPRVWPQLVAAAVLLVGIGLGVLGLLGANEELRLIGNFKVWGGTKDASAPLSWAQFDDYMTSREELDLPADSHVAALGMVSLVNDNVRRLALESEGELIEITDVMAAASRAWEDDELLQLYHRTRNAIQEPSARLAELVAAEADDPELLDKLELYVRAAVDARSSDVIGAFAERTDGRVTPFHFELPDTLEVLEGAFTAKGSSLTPEQAKRIRTAFYSYLLHEPTTDGARASYARLVEGTELPTLAFGARVLDELNIWAGDPVAITLEDGTGFELVAIEVTAPTAKERRKYPARMPTAPFVIDVGAENVTVFETGSNGDKLDVKLPNYLVILSLEFNVVSEVDDDGTKSGRRFWVDFSPGADAKGEQEQGAWGPALACVFRRYGDEQDSWSSEDWLRSVEPILDVEVKWFTEEQGEDPEFNNDDSDDSVLVGYHALAEFYRAWADPSVDGLFITP